MTVSFATPPIQPFNPGQTLDPSCAPGESNCTVTPISVGGTLVANATPSSVLFTDSTNHLASTGSVPVVQGGTGATDIVTARGNLGLAYASASDVTTSTNIAAWGDSFTAAGYPPYLAAITGYTIFNGGIGGETSSQIKARFDADTAKHSWPTIIWAGRNNIADPAQIKSDIAAMVAALGHSRYVVISIFNSNLEPSGNVDYNTIMQLNADLAATYGSHFIDVRSYIVSQYDSSQAQDVIDHANDVSPTSLRADALHLNDTGYLKAATYISQHIAALVPTTETLLTTKNIQSLFVQNNSNLNFSNATVGIRSLAFNTTGFSNTALGAYSLYFNTTGIDNTASGYGSLYSNTTGNYNVASGVYAMRYNTTGTSNTGIGAYSLTANTTGSYNTATGYNSLSMNTTGSNNTADGFTSLYSNTTGSYNSAIGINALFSNTIGNSNTALGGYGVLFSNVSGNNNNAIGYQALYSNTTGNNNVADGLSSLYNNKTGSANVAIGREAGYGVLNSTDAISNNVFIGYRAGYGVLSGANSNILVGYQAGDTITTGTHNLILGYDIDAPSNTASNQLNIGNAIFGTTISGSGTTVSTGNLGLFVSAPSARLQLPAGSATASTAPLKFTSGTSLTTPEAGAIEYDGTSLFFTPAATRYNVVMNGLGLSGGQSIVGGTGSGENLTLVSTTNSTKGKIIFGASGTSAYDGTTGFLGIGTTSPGALLTINGNISAANWTSAGIGLSIPAATYTNTTSSGTVSLIAAHSIGVPTLASTSATSYTSAATLYIAGAPLGSGNATVSGTYALYVAGGTTALFGNAFFGTNVGNIWVTGTTGSTSTNAAQYLFAGATNVNIRTGFYGSATTAIGAGNSYAAVAVGSAPVTTPATGTNALLANMVISPIGTITQGAASVTNTASLYIGGAATATVTGSNYAFWVASGMSQFGSAAVTTGTAVATFQNAGGTCVITPSISAGVTCSSDMNLKKNITTLADSSAWSYNTNITTDNQSVLAKVLALTPVDYNWNVESDTDAKHAGFIAQEVRQVFPDLVTEDAKTHLLSLNYAGMMPYAVEAIREMNVNITDIANLDRPNTWREALISWLGGENNGIKKIRTDELCVGTACVTQQQFLQMMQGNNGGGSTTSSSAPSAPAPVVEEPVPASGATQTPDVSAPVPEAPAEITTDSVVPQADPAQ